MPLKEEKMLLCWLKLVKRKNVKIQNLMILFNLKFFHGRMFEKRLGKNELIQFDVLSHYKKYTDIIEIDDVPEEE